MIKKVLFFIISISSFCFAGINVSGLIYDLQTQQGISGTTVSIAGTNLSTTTSSDGSFTLSNIPVYSTGFQFKITKSGYVDAYSQIGNAGDSDEGGISFPMLSNTIYNQIHSPVFGGIAHTSGKADIMGRVSSGESGVSGVVITARYMDNNTVAGTVRYVNTSNMPDSSLQATSENGIFIIYNVDPYKPIKITGTKQGNAFTSFVVVCYPDSISIGGIEQIDALIPLSGIISWNENPVTGATVSIPGTTSSSTTDANGRFSIQFNPTSYGVLKISKQNYIDTYFAGRADEYEEKKQNGDQEMEFFIIPQADYTDVLNALGKTHIPGKGDVMGVIQTINDIEVSGAKVNVYDRNGNKLNPDIFYFDEEGNPSTQVGETTNTGQYFILNLDPGYYFIIAEKSGIEFSRNMVMVFANGISNAPEIIGFPPLPGISKYKGNDIPASNIGPGSQNVGMLAFQFGLMKWETDENVVFDSIIVTSKGTGNISTALSSAKLYLDADFNGTYETEVSTGIISGNKITFRNINKEIDYGLNQNYLIVFNFNGTASIGQTFGVDILKNSDVYAHAKNSGIAVTCFGEPLIGNLMTVAHLYPPDKPSNVHPGNAQTGIDPFNYYLESSSFSQGQGSLIHKASEWRIWKDGESYETLTWSSGEDGTNLTTILPPVSLEGSTTYWWQVRYQNGDNVWSQWSDATCFTTTENGITPPGKPENQSPAHGASEVPLPVTLTSSPFIPGTNTTHLASQWQVFLAAKTDTPIFDTKRDVNNKTSITVTGLSYNTHYVWRVRYQDGYGAWSQWSDFTDFTTKQGMKGDLNHDTQIDISDVILCLRMAIRLDPLDILGDMNDDGEIDISDVILILRKAIGLE